MCLQSKPPRARDTCRRYQGTGRPQAAYQKARRQFGTHQPPRVCGVSGRGDSLSAHATRKPSNHRPSLRLRDRSAPSTASDLVLTTRNGTLRAELQRRVRPSRVVTILQRIEPPRGDKGALTEAAASRGLRPRNAVLRSISLNLGPRPIAPNSAQVIVVTGFFPLADVEAQRYIAGCNRPKGAR